MNAHKFFIGVLLLVLITGQAAAHTAETEGMSFEYGNNWRISGKSTDMLTLTHTEKPGAVLLSVSKIPAGGNLNDLWSMYKKKLASFGAEMEELPPGNVGRQSTIRFLTRLPNQPDVVVLNQLFEANGNFYLAAVTAKEDDFITYVREAEPVLNSMKFSGKGVKAVPTTNIKRRESRGMKEKITSAIKGIGGKITEAVKSVIGTIKGLLGISGGEKIQAPQTTSPPTTLTTTSPPKTIPPTTSPPVTRPPTSVLPSPSPTQAPTTTIEPSTTSTTSSSTSTASTSISSSTTLALVTTTTTVPVPKGPVLEIINKRTIDNIDDRLWVTGSIRNIGGASAFNVKVRLIVYNPQGSVLQILSTPPLSMVAPGETVAFNTLRSDIVNSAVGSYELSTDYRE